MPPEMLGPFVDTHNEHTGGSGVNNRKKQRKQCVLVESDDDDDKYENKETSEYKRTKPKRRKVRVLTRHVISQRVASCSLRICHVMWYDFIQLYHVNYTIISIHFIMLRSQILP